MRVRVRVRVRVRDRVRVRVRIRVSAYRAMHATGQHARIAPMATWQDRGKSMVRSW